MLSSGSERVKLSTMDHHVKGSRHSFVLKKKHVLYYVFVYRTEHNYILYIPFLKKKNISNTRTRDKI